MITARCLNPKRPRSELNESLTRLSSLVLGYSPLLQAYQENPLSWSLHHH
jgi:hypothetical protein